MSVIKTIAKYCVCIIIVECSILLGIYIVIVFLQYMNGSLV